MNQPAGLPDDIVDLYELDGAAVEVLTGGRTNTTMRATGGRDLVVQHMGAGAGLDLLGVMENLVRVTAHLDWRRQFAGAPSWYPVLVPTRTGQPFVLSDAGDLWRAFMFRPGRIVRTASSLATLAAASRLYGRFLAETADLGGPDLVTTRHGFHDLGVVAEGFRAALDAEHGTRGDEIRLVHPLIDRVGAKVEERVGADGLADAPLRVVHNDTKLSNVLFSTDHLHPDTAIAVLDLDLAMMGPAWHDFGDIVRSLSWYVETNGEPTCPPGLFAAIARAYVDGADGVLTEADIATFATAGPRLSFELGLRYLHDHLRTVPVLRVSAPNGHLHRGIAHIRLAEEMLGAYDALRRVVDTLLAEGE